MSLLHLIFILSHLVVVVEQGRYFDTSFMKALTDVNQLRYILYMKLLSTNSCDLERLLKTNYVKNYYKMKPYQKCGLNMEDFRVLGYAFFFRSDV